MMRKFTVFLGLMVALSLPVSASAKNYNWKLAHHRSPEAQVHKDLLEFSEKVKQGTNGEVNISIMAGGQLGSWTVAQERVAMGNFEMTIAPMATAVDKRMECALLPAAILDWETASKKFVAGSPFIDLISKWALEQNLLVLAPYPFYLGGIGFTKEIENPQDATLKRGIKVRIPELAAFRLMVEGLGYIPTPIAMTDTFPALQTGVVDGISGGGAEVYYTGGLADVLKAYLPANTHFEVWFMLVNPKKFSSLPKEYQDVIRKESIALQDKRLKDGPNEAQKWEKALSEKGVKVYTLTPEQLAAYQKIMRDSSWASIRKVVGEKAFDEAVSLLQ